MARLGKEGGTRPLWVWAAAACWACRDGSSRRLRHEHPLLIKSSLHDFSARLPPAKFSPAVA
jgi:hypothetical protein